MKVVVTPSPEHERLGGGVYHTLRTIAAQDDARVFRLVPAPAPLAGMAVLSAFMLALLVAVPLVVKHYGLGGPPRAFWVAWFCIGLVVTAGVNALFAYSYRRERRLGPCFEYDKLNKTVTLPRQGRSFPLEDVLYVQWLTELRGRYDDSTARSELQLVTRGEEREPTRWHILNTLAPCDHLLRPMVEHTPLHVLRVKPRLWGEGLTVEPYS